MEKLNEFLLEKFLFELSESIIEVNLMEKTILL